MSIPLNESFLILCFSYIVRKADSNAESDERKDVSLNSGVEVVLQTLKIHFLNCRVALQIARSREMLNWFGSFYALATVAMVAGYRRSRTPGVLVPLLPLTFVLGYQTDLAYGNKLHRIKGWKKNGISTVCTVFLISL